MAKKKNTSDMRSYKILSVDPVKRIQELTPTSINGIDVSFQIINDPSCLIKSLSASTTKSHRITYINMECVFTKKIRSFPVILRSAPRVVEPSLKAVVTAEEYKAEIENAKQYGWAKCDLFYDAIIKHLVVKDAEECFYLGEKRPEIGFASDNLCIIVSDYKKSQFVGWFFYNKNTDRLLSFTSYRI